MTSRTEGLGSFIAAVFVLVLAVGCVALGFATSKTSPATTPAPNPSATPAVWIQRLADAQVSLEANTTALHAARLTGQPIDRLTAQCLTAAADFNHAATHLNTPPINPDQECRTR